MASWNDSSLKGLKSAYGHIVPADEGPQLQGDSPNAGVQSLIDAERSTRAPRFTNEAGPQQSVDNMLAEAKGTIASGNRFMNGIERDTTTADQEKRFAENNPEDPHSVREFSLGALQALRKPSTLATIGTLAAAPFTGGMSLPAGMATIGGAGALGSFAGGIAQQAAGDEDAPKSLGENTMNALGTGVTEAAIAGAPVAAIEGGGAALRGLKAMSGSRMAELALEGASHLPYGIGTIARWARTAQTLAPYLKQAAAEAPIAEHAGAAVSAARNVKMASTARVPMDQAEADLSEAVHGGLRVPGVTPVDKASSLLEPQISVPTRGRFDTPEQYAKKAALEGVQNAGRQARAGIEARTTAHTAAEAENVAQNAPYGTGPMPSRMQPTEQLPESWKPFTKGGGSAAPAAPVPEPYTGPVDEAGRQLGGHAGPIGSRMYEPNQPMQPMPHELRRLADLAKKNFEAKRATRPRGRQ